MAGARDIFIRSRGHFGRFVDAQTNSAEASLPVTHTTDAFDFRDISSDGEVRPRHCGNFDIDLFYCFYGRPAYRKNGSVQANSLAAYAPIVFLFKPDVLRGAAVAFPFDSGAFKGELYSDLTHHRMQVEDFAFEPTTEQIGKIIAFFYGDDKRYFDQVPARTKKLARNEFEASSYQELTLYKGKNERDDRSTTIEILFERAIRLRENLLAIVVPASFLKDNKVKEAIARLDVHTLPYTDGVNLTPGSQIPRLCDIVRNFYIKQSLMRK